MEAQYYLESHKLTGYSMQSLPNGDSNQSLNESKVNELVPDYETYLYLDNDLENIICESGTPENVLNLSYNRGSINFTPVKRFGSSIALSVEYKIKGCPKTQYCTFDFEMVSTYNVSYISSSKIIQIERNGDMEKMRAAFVSSYLLVDVTTGIVKKQGSLSSERINQIDVSFLSSGIYALKILSGNSEKNYKILID